MNSTKDTKRRDYIYILNFGFQIAISLCLCVFVVGPLGCIAWPLRNVYFQGGRLERDIFDWRTLELFLC